MEAASAFWSCSVISHPRWGIKSLAEPTDTVTMIVMIIMVVMIIIVVMVVMVTKVIRDKMVIMVALLSVTRGGELKVYQNQQSNRLS